jgi:hypothetical protein
MSKSITIEEAVQILQSGIFDDFLGVVEDHQIEFKGSPYRLDHDKEKHELAKDVSALANAQGGIILVGFATTISTGEELVTSREYVESARPFDPALISIDQYRKILQDWIYPSVGSLDIRIYHSFSDREKGVLAILVPPSAIEQKPYIVTRTVEPSGKVRGTLIGFYERVQERIPPTSAEALRDYLKDGQRFVEIMRRLDTIEAFLGRESAPVVPISPSPIVLDQINRVANAFGSSAVTEGPSNEETRSRVSEAVKAIGREGRANMILTATTTTKITFPSLFRSGSEPLVRLLENPPMLRPEGFIVTPKSDIQSEIVHGKARRVALKGLSSQNSGRTDSSSLLAKETTTCSAGLCVTTKT